jgi:predicted Mrr-cat superfamily restriction endonuclease
MTVMWRIRAWQDPDLERHFLDDGLIAVSADELGDLSSGPTDHELEQLLQFAHPDKGPKTIAIWKGYWRIFLTEMQIGDRVLLPLLGGRYALGEITGSYHYCSMETNSYLRHTRTVRWLRTGPRRELPENIRKVVNAPGTVCRVRDPSGL